MSKPNIEPVYKVNYLVNNEIQKIIVFNGVKSKKKGPIQEEEFKRKNGEVYKVPIFQSEQQIHYDDTIGTIKLKILSEFKKMASLDEIYLFCQKVETLNPISVYQTLTQNKKITLTHIRLQQFISNIVSDTNGNKLEEIPVKDIYSYDDILSLKIAYRKFIINKVLGQKFFIVENEYPFTSNPYDVVEYDSFFERASRKSLSTLNSHLLLNTGEIVDNNIYLCLAKDVVQYSITKNINQQTTIKIYYPFLYNKNINSFNDFTSSEEKYNTDNSKLLTEKTLESFKTVDMFYDVYKLKKSELSYVSNGIKYIKAVIKPDFNIKIPLEVIFKVIHATQNNPLIKYNPSSKQENIYRLYTDRIATDGRKIPYLKKGLIFKSDKEIGRTKSVTVLIENKKMSDKKGDDSQIIYCEFDENGYITISTEFQQIVDKDKIDEIFREAINPIITEIKNHLEQNGYKINLFDSLNNENIEVKQLTYQSKIQITKPIKLESFKGCISCIFNNESTEFKQGIHLRFKRVSNFNKVTSQEAFILEKQEEGFRGDEIVQALLDNYPDDLTQETALDLVRKVANEIQVERGVRKSDIKIKNNPGFKTIIQLDQKISTITITVENMNDINYLSIIPVYLDTMIRLTQDIKSTGFPSKEITRICSSGEKEDIVAHDIISSVESQLSENEEPSIEEDTEDVVYKKTGDISSVSDSESEIDEDAEEKVNNALSLFFDDDDDEESIESATIGGQESTSESSIESEESIKTASSLPETNNNVDEESSEEEEEEESSEEEEEEEEEIKPVARPKLNIVSSSDEEETSSDEEETSSDEEETSSDEEDDDEEDDEEEDEEEGNEEEDDEEDEEEEENIVQNIDGMPLRNYFQGKIEEKDSKLIVKSPVKNERGEFSIYSKICQSIHKRQPVILTDTELDKINKEHKDFLRPEDIIKYGSDPNNQFNYICPRYWCLKTNKPIDPNEFKEVEENGKKILVHPTCGKIIPEDEEKVIPGHYVYEFYKPKRGDEKYKKYPGFIPDKHPDGYCLPCCFDKYNTEGRIKAKEKCEAKKSANEEPNKKDDKPMSQDEYIYGPEKFPLLQGRWGYLPMQIQQILNELNEDCQISKTNSNIKMNHPCLLRHGIEVNYKQSFIACVSDALYFAKKIKSENSKVEKFAKVLSIKEMKQRIIKSLTIDNFITYQNGNLVKDFYSNSENAVDINKYDNTKLFTQINLEDEKEKLFFSKIVSSFENFINFLNDDDVIIDHSYLWDIICQPNKYLFPLGINLIIFEIPNNDITNNVRLVCPTNHYSNEFYESRKDTIFLLKEDDYYEPIYSYTINEKSIKVKKDFSEHDTTLSKTMREVFTSVIKPYFKNICTPLESMPENGLLPPSVYKVRKPLNLYSLIEELDKCGYKILKFVLNFNSKVIGVLANSQNSKINGFVPCYPSGLNDELKQTLGFVFMNDLSLWNNYNDTMEFLTVLEKKSKKRGKVSIIPCKPMFKVVEDVLVVGILTETDQFIQLSKNIPESDIEEGSKYYIPTLKNSNYIINKDAEQMESVDSVITISNKVDEERVDYIKKIKLETNFYNVFRNTVRILLIDYENIKIKDKIETEIKKQYITYNQKLTNINKLLIKLVNDKIQFIGDSNYYKLIQEVSTCIVKDKDSCKNTPNLCALTEGDKCKLILPEKNLLTNKPNEAMYYNKMADELIRYNRIKSFMLQPEMYLSFGNIGYNLRDNEIILTQSSLTQEYFEDIIEAKINKYVGSTSYDEARPIISQNYDNTIKNLGQHNVEEEECKKTVKNKISTSQWASSFPKNFSEISYGKTIYCTFNIVMDIIGRKTGSRISVSEIKNVLYDEYKKYLQNYGDKILDILSMEGKKSLCERVRTGALSFTDFIYSEKYFISPFDLWLIVNKFEIPTIFISQTPILQSSYETTGFIAYGEEENKFLFIVIPSFKNETEPGFKIIEDEEKSIFISLNKLINTENVRNIVFDDKITIKSYLVTFTKNIKPPPPVEKVVKPKKKLLISDEDDEEEDEVEIKKPNIVEEVMKIPEIEYVEKPKTKTKKVKAVAVKKRNQTAKNTKLLIVDSSD
jgi:hypothetical protein